MEMETIFILLFVVATAVAIAVQRLAIPYTVALVFTGLVLGWLHAFEAPHLTKALLFNVFLPGLLFEAAFHIEFKQFWRNRLTIHSLALPGVISAITLTALILTPVTNTLHFVEGFTWKHALVERDFTHYLPDEQNSPWAIRMLVSIGGEDSRFGQFGGIHWHIANANTIEYIARDSGRQDIPWVRPTDRSGKVTVYQSADNPLKPEQLAAAHPRVMDCIDCHNRPTHIYHAPVDSVDAALRSNRIDHNLPYIKKEAVQTLTKTYPSTDQALSSIARILTTFYQTNYPRLTKTNPQLVAAAVTEVQRIYQHNFFPDMKVNWRAYPDHIGHMNFSGCFRCHDGNHTSADGKSIVHDCNACHTIIVQGPEGKPETSLTGLEFRHPVDISGQWKETNCSDCHDGSLAE